MTIELGEPKHYSNCVLCERHVGGPYFDKSEARARLREHIRNTHDAYRLYQKHEPSPEQKRPFKRGSFVG